MAQWTKDIQFHSSRQVVQTETEDSLPLVNPEDDSEIRSNKVEVKPTTSSGLDSCRFLRFSSWNSLIRALVLLRMCVRRHQGTKSEINDADFHLDMARMVIKDVQRKAYQEELSCLRSSKPLNKSSSIFNPDPYIDADGLLRVGGRLKYSHLEFTSRNPVILPAKHHVSTLIARKCHNDSKHQGRHITEGCIRSSGYWLVGGKRLVSSLIHSCVTCRRLRRKLDHQKMSDLPEERVIPGHPPFSFVGVDVFGPWEIITRRTRGGAANSKRWAALFTCLSARAVHIEVLEDMTASAFINALRRFIAIRG